MQQSTGTAGARGGGARRVYNYGNLALSTAIFLLALAACMTALDPQKTHIFLSARHRTPSLDYVESSLLGGFTPVTVSVGNRTGLVIPATGVHGTRDIAAALTGFFATDVNISATASTPTEVAATDEGLEREDTSVTLSDVYAAVLLRGSPHTTAFLKAGSVRRPRVVHLCSALACTMPYVAQQWADRAALLWSLSNSTTDHTHAKAVHPVTNFALVFGEATEAAAVLTELAEQRVLTAQQAPTQRDAQAVMPLVGDEARMAGAEVSCAALGQCRYRTASLHNAIAASMGLASQKEPTSLSAVSGVVEEWWRRGNGTASRGSWHSVPVTPASSTVFNNMYKLDQVAFDLAHVDVRGADSVAAVAFLNSLAMAKTRDSAPPPANILVTFYASEWMHAMVTELESLERVGEYAAIPLHRACVFSSHGGFSPRERWRVSRMGDELRRRPPVQPPYVSSGLWRSRGVQQPLCTVLLSRDFATLDALLDATAAAMPPKPVRGTPVERFLYDSLGISPVDDARLFSGDLTTAPHSPPPSTTSVVGVAKSIFGFVARYIYFFIPVVVGGVLTRNVCRRGGRR